MIKLGIIFGGRSGEHEVSLMSAASVLRAVDRTKYDPVMIGITKNGEWKLFRGEIDEVENGAWKDKAEPLNVGDLKKYIDFALPIMHGTYGEDGTIQGLFEMLDIPYGGCGVLASSAAMDKIIAKELFINAGLPSCRYTGIETYSFKNEDAEDIEKKVGGYPCFVKPANMGSSVGVSKADDREELIEAIHTAARFDRRVIIEEGMDIREIETAMIGNEEPVNSSIGEILSGSEFYDYEAKYTDGFSTLSIPADIPEKTAGLIKEYAVRAYKALDCAGFARIDFFVEKTTGEVYINEINTIPGFTKYSMFPLLFGDAGIPYPALIERIVDYGYERYNTKNNRQTNI